jgi:signal transduction histidine kinase
LYFTTKKRGSGIGLSLVFRTIQLHNGDIDVESTVGTGTTFTIKLPRAR